MVIDHGNKLQKSFEVQTLCCKEEDVEMAMEAVRVICQRKKLPKNSNYKYKTAQVAPTIYCFLLARFFSIVKSTLVI